MSVRQTASDRHSYQLSHVNILSTLCVTAIGLPWNSSCSGWCLWEGDGGRESGCVLTVIVQ